MGHTSTKYGPCYLFFNGGSRWTRVKQNTLQIRASIINETRFLTGLVDTYTGRPPKDEQPFKYFSFLHFRTQQIFRRCHT